VIVLRICVTKVLKIQIKNFPLKNHEKSLKKPSKKTSALTYDFYCFKHLKITLLWQKPTTEKILIQHFFSFQKNTSLNKLDDRTNLKVTHYPEIHSFLILPTFLVK